MTWIEVIDRHFGRTNVVRIIQYDGSIVLKIIYFGQDFRIYKYGTNVFTLDKYNNGIMDSNARGLSLKRVIFLIKHPHAVTNESIANIAPTRTIYNTNATIFQDSYNSNAGILTQEILESAINTVRNTSGRLR